MRRALPKLGNSSDLARGPFTTCIRGIPSRTNSFPSQNTQVSARRSSAGSAKRVLLKSTEWEGADASLPSVRFYLTRRHLAPPRLRSADTQQRLPKTTNIAQQAPTIARHFTTKFYAILRISLATSVSCLMWIPVYTITSVGRKTGWHGDKKCFCTKRGSKAYFLMWAACALLGHSGFGRGRVISLAKNVCSFRGKFNRASNGRRVSTRGLESAARRSNALSRSFILCVTTGHSANHDGSYSVLRSTMSLFHTTITSRTFYIWMRCNAARRVRGK